MQKNGGGICFAFPLLLLFHYESGSENKNPQIFICNRFGADGVISPPNRNDPSSSLSDSIRNKATGVLAKGVCGESSATPKKKYPRMLGLAVHLALRALWPSGEYVFAKF